MEYGLSDSSGTDDDLPPPHQKRFASGGPATGNGRSAVIGNAQFPRMQNDMETQIHHIEQEAYSSVLRAFKAQSDAITWEMESLITELRKELRVSDEEHRELLSRVNADDIIMRIREWRKVNGLQPGMLNSSQPVMHDPMRSPTASASHKKQKTSQPVASLSMGAPSPAFHQSMQPSSSALKRGSVSGGGRGKKPKSNASAGFTGRAQVPKQGSAGAFRVNELAEDNSSDPLIGRKVWTRWPEDKSFYEAVITDYNPIESRHALVYDINTPNEAWEWVNLKEISPDDIRWKNEDIGISHRGGRSGSGRGFRKAMTRGGISAAAGRGRGIIKGPSKRELPPSQSGIGKKALNDIEILHTDTLVKEVEKVFSASHADPLDIEKAKKVLKEHEQALVDAIARLEEASDGESDRGEQHRSSQGQSIDQDQGSRKQRYREVGEGRMVEGSDGGKVANGQIGDDDMQMF